MSPQSSGPNACLICGEAGFAEVRAYDVPDMYERAVGVATDGYWRQWVRCRGCGFHYSRYSRPVTALDDLYRADYRSGTAAWRDGATTRQIFERVIKLPADQSETKERVGWIKSEIAALAGQGIVRLRPAPRRMLDIGGATGVFAYEFRDADWTSHVIDPAEESVFLETDYGIPYRRREYAPGAFGVDFDLASMVFVLEHLVDPLAALAATRDDVARGGLVYVEVPDALAFTRKPPEDDIFCSCHLWMFDPVSLTALVARAGYEVAALRRAHTLRGHYALRALAVRS